MKYVLTLCLFALASTGLHAAEEKTKEPSMGQMSYAVGYYIGSKFLGDEDLVLDEVVKGIREARLAGDNPSVSLEEIQKLVMQYGMRQQMKHQEEVDVAMKKNQEAGLAFQANYKKDKRTVVHPDGFLYRVIKEGKGESPTLEDTVEVYYVLKNTDGKVIQANNKEEPPISLPLSHTVRGWQLALPAMKAGSTWEVVLPPDLAYGDRQVSADIGPNQTLVFEIQLVGVKKGDTEEQEGQ